MLFFKKKKKEEKELPPLKFPDFPKYEPPRAPFSEPLSDVPKIKEAIDIPIRKPLPPRPPLAQLDKLPRMPEIRPMSEFKPLSKQTFDEEEFQTPIQHIQKGRNMFVKIENYEKALHTIKELQNKLTEAEKVMARINEAKQKEDAEINSLQSDIDLLKSKLLKLDKTLFE